VRYEDKGPPTSPNRFEHAATSMGAAKKYISWLLGHTLYIHLLFRMFTDFIIHEVVVRLIWFLFICCLLLSLNIPVIW